MILLQFLLINLQNILKFDVLATKTEVHQLTKMELQMVSIQMPRLTFIAYIKSLSIIRQSMTVPVEPAGKLNLKKLYKQLHVLNTCTASLKFMTEMYLLYDM